jgi:hypothetical protein
MTDSLRDTVLARLDRESREDWAALVLGALDGPEALAAYLDTGAAAAPARVAAQSAAKEPAATPAFLKSITVEGFRGIGPMSGRWPHSRSRRVPA